MGRESIFLQFLSPLKYRFFLLCRNTPRAGVGFRTLGLLKLQAPSDNLTFQLGHQDPPVMASEPAPYVGQTLLWSGLLRPRWREFLQFFSHFKPQVFFPMSLHLGLVRAHGHWAGSSCKLPEMMGPAIVVSGPSSCLGSEGGVGA